MYKRKEISSRKKKDIHLVAQQKIIAFLQDVLADADCLQALDTKPNQDNFAVRLEIPIDKYGKTPKKALKKYQLCFLSPEKKSPYVICLETNGIRITAFQSTRPSLKIELSLTEDEKKKLILLNKEQSVNIMIDKSVDKAFAKNIVARSLIALAKRESKLWIEACCKAILVVDVGSKKFQSLLYTLDKLIAEEEKISTIKLQFINLINNIRDSYVKKIHKTKECISTNRNTIIKQLYRFDGVFSDNDDEWTVINKAIQYLSEEKTPLEFQFILQPLRAYAVYAKNFHWDGDRAFLEHLKELQSTIIGFFSDQIVFTKPGCISGQGQKSAANQLKQQDQNPIKYLALMWGDYFNQNTEDAKEVLQYFITLCIHPQKDSSLILMTNINDLTYFLQNISGLSKEKEQELIGFIIENMGEFIFSLIDNHFQQEDGPPGRDNSLISAIISSLILNDEMCSKHVVKCIQPVSSMVKLMSRRGLDFQTLKQGFDKNADDELFVPAFKIAIESLFAIQQYPMTTRRIVQGFLSKPENKDKLIGYFLIRFINPLIIRYAKQQLDVSSDWYEQFIVFVFQALTATEAKKISYQQKMPTSLLCFVYNPVVRDAANTAIQMISPVDIHEYGFSMPSQPLLWSKTVIVKAVFINHKSYFLLIEGEFLRLCRKTGFVDLMYEYQKSSLDNRIEHFNDAMQKLKGLFTQELKLSAANQSYLEIITELKKYLTWACFCLQDLLHLELNGDTTEIILSLTRVEYSALMIEALGKVSYIQGTENDLITYRDSLKKRLLPGMDKKTLLINEVALFCQGIMGSFEANKSYSGYDIQEDDISALEELEHSFKSFHKKYIKLGKQCSQKKSSSQIMAKIGFYATESTTTEAELLSESPSLQCSGKI